MYHIILAGGSGTRFWPLSTDKKPKQFLNIFNDESLIKSTYNRLLKVASSEKIFILASEKYSSLIKKEISNANIIIEPSPNNTTSAIYLAAKYILNLDREALLGFYPSDHYINDQGNKFSETVIKAESFLNKNKKAILTIGLKPSYPSTEYGYIQIKKDNLHDFVNIHKASRFIEKPSSDDALKLINETDNLWNIGVFFFSAETIINEIEKNVTEFKNYSESFMQKWHLLPSISIDYSVMEKTENCYCINSQFTWSDIGNWESLYKILPKDKSNNAIQGRHLAYNSRNNLIISPKKLIATVGLDNIAVIDTDDTILIVNLTDSGDIKKLIKKK